MFNSFLKSIEAQTYIRSNENRDVREITLQKSPFPDATSAELAQQIKGLQIAKVKLPTFYSTNQILYPPTINLEQTSSEATAQYKAKLVSGKSIIDLTSGFGVDSWAFSFNFKKVVSIERNAELAEMVRYNYLQLKRKNIDVIVSEFEPFLKNHPKENWDVIYVDPSRRKGSKRKFLLADLEPDILQWMDQFRQKAKTVLVKLSPLMDLIATTEQIPTLHEIHVVAVKNEVKELLLIANHETVVSPKVHCVNLGTNQADFSFRLENEALAITSFSLPLNYLYEPNAAILKSGAFKLIGEKYSLKKLHPNTHLYTSSILRTDFPGRIYHVETILKNYKKSIRNSFFHVISKNFPLTVEEIRTKYKIKESEKETLIFTTSIDGKIVLLCNRIN